MVQLEKRTLNEWRVLRGYEVAELTQVADASALCSYLYQGKTPLTTTAIRLAEALGVEVSQIIWGRADYDQDVAVPPMPKSPAYDPKSGVPVISEEQLAIMVAWAAAGRSKTQIHEAMGVSRQTFYTALEKYESEHGPVRFKRGRVKKPSAPASRPRALTAR